MARTPRASKEEEDRLELVWAALTNPRRTIGSIQLLAAEHGFHDLVAFNEAFRARYGNSPAEIRKAARRRRMRRVMATRRAFSPRSVAAAQPKTRAGWIGGWL